MIKRPDDMPPETRNDEQEDEPQQAHSIAEEALDATAQSIGSRQSTKAKGGIQDEDDISDLIDHMTQMTRSGTIDMSAYDGEETMDDLENRYGAHNAADSDFSQDDS